MIACSMHIQCFNKPLAIVLCKFFILFFTSIQNSVDTLTPMSTSHQRSFANPGQWVWCINVETGSIPMQTIPDASEKDVMSQNQTHVLKKHRGHMLCAYSFRA